MSNPYSMIQYDHDDGTPLVHFGSDGLKGTVFFTGDQISVCCIIDGKIVYLGSEVTIPGLKYDLKFPG
jgi:hypothetical protein